jgi:hypothetical protein
MEFTGDPTSGSCGGGSGSIASVRRSNSSNLDLDVMTPMRAIVDKA